MREERYCTNCRATIAPDATECEACGFLVEDVFDGRIRTSRGPSRLWPWILLILAAAAAGAWMYLREEPVVSRPVPTEPAPISVVRQRPGGTRRAAGAKINEAEAIRALRRHLGDVKPECLAISSQGPRGSRYQLTAVDSCNGVRLGRFVVDGDGNVSRGR